MPSRSLATERETICTTPVEDIITQTFVLLATARESKCLIWPEPRSPAHGEEGKKKEWASVAHVFLFVILLQLSVSKKERKCGCKQCALVRVFFVCTN